MLLKKWLAVTNDQLPNQLQAASEGPLREPMGIGCFKKENQWALGTIKSARRAINVFQIGNNSLLFNFVTIHIPIYYRNTEIFPICSNISGGPD